MAKIQKKKSQTDRYCCSNNFSRHHWKKYISNNLFQLNFFIDWIMKSWIYFDNFIFQIKNRNTEKSELRVFLFHHYNLLSFYFFSFFFQISVPNKFVALFFIDQTDDTIIVAWSQNPLAVCRLFITQKIALQMR